MSEEALLVVGCCPACEVLTYYDKPVVHKANCAMLPMLRSAGLKPLSEDTPPEAPARSCVRCGVALPDDFQSAMLHVVDCEWKRSGDEHCPKCEMRLTLEEVEATIGHLRNIIGAWSDRALEEPGMPVLANVIADAERFLKGLETPGFTKQQLVNAVRGAFAEGRIELPQGQDTTAHEFWTRCERCGERVLMGRFALEEHMKTCISRDD